MATENVQEAAAAAAEKLAEAAAAAGGEASPGEDDVEEMMLSGEQDQWSFLTKAAIAVMVIIVCLIANKVIRGETPEEKRLRLRNQRRAKKKADSKNEPDVARSDVKVEVTGTMLKLSLRNQPVIAGNLFKPVDPEGCTWQIDNPGPGQPKEVTITLLKAEPAKSREAWWRAPLKGLETRRPAPKPADPEMPGPAGVGAVGGGGGQQAAPGNTVTAAASNGNTPRSAAGTAGGPTPSAGVAAAGAGKSPAGAGNGEAAGAAAAGAAAAAAAAATPPSSQKSGKGGGKKKNRKKNCYCRATLELKGGLEVKTKQKRAADGWGQARRAPPASVVAM
ncbi:unnamed protein product [Ectocarpus sp. 6 AP-2014]